MDEILKNPVTNGKLSKKGKEIIDLDTGKPFPMVEVENGRIVPDLRATEVTQVVELQIQVPCTLPDISYFLKFFKATKADYQAPSRETLRKKFGTKLQKEILYYVDQILKQNPNPKVLDIGCGPGGTKKFLNSIGIMDVVSVDYWSSEAEYLVDAHRLPFRDKSFDVIMTMATPEHFYNPLLAFSEISRTLKDNGHLLASGSFMESWHANSCFHFSPHGFYILCHNSGLELHDMWSGWGFLASVTTMAITPKLRRFGYFLQSVFDFLVRIFFGEEAVYKHRLMTSGSFGIYARKNPASSGRNA